MPPPSPVVATPPPLQPRQQTIKQLEGLLVKAVKAGGAPTAQARGAALQELELLDLELPAARAALGAAK